MEAIHIHAQSNQPGFDGSVVKLRAFCCGEDPKLVGKKSFDFFYLFFFFVFFVGRIFFFFFFFFGLPFFPGFLSSCCFVI